MKTLAVTLLFLGAAITTSLVTNSEFSHFGRDFTYPAYLSARLSPLPFLAAAILMYFKPRLGYLVALTAALVALPWFAITELRGSWNSWSALNHYEFEPAQDADYFLTQATLKILATLLVVTTAALCVLRLTSSRSRTWPALAVSAFVLVAWFVYSVTPYRVPSFGDHRSAAQLRILHVQKRGLQFQETNVTVWPHGDMYTNRVERRLFHYRFTARLRRMFRSMSPSASQCLRNLLQSSQQWNPQTPPFTPIRSWNGEGWYVVAEDARLFDYGTTPPEDVTNLFQELETLPAKDELITHRDVCLGFCYDPLAGLGFTTLPQRNRLLNHTP